MEKFLLIFHKVTKMKTGNLMFMLKFKIGEVLKPLLNGILMYIQDTTILLTILLKLCQWKIIGTLIGKKRKLFGTLWPYLSDKSSEILKTILLVQLLDNTWKITTWDQPLVTGLGYMLEIIILTITLFLSIT